MVKEGEYIIYGMHGVCKFDGVMTLNMKNIPKDKKYCKLIPVNEGGTIYAPAEACEENMRPIITKDEANALIMKMKEIPPIGVADEKYVEMDYKSSFREQDYTKLVRMLKYIYQRKQIRALMGRRMTITDEKYMKMAETSLYTELGIALNIPVDEVVNYITKMLKD